MNGEPASGGRPTGPDGGSAGGGAGSGGGDGLSAQGRAIQRFFVTVGEVLARWTRLDYEGPSQLPEGPALIVANHGFGGIFDPNAFALAALADRLRPDDRAQVTVLTHQLAWTLGVGRLLEPAGFRPASREAALDGLAAGRYVLVLPGGDLDAGKDFSRRNQVVFGGRSGFARIALDAGVPIIPVVVSGAGETLLVLNDGRRLARALRLPELARTKTLPVSLSLPYGLSVGVAGMLPYLPLPAKMRAAVLDPVVAAEHEDAGALAARVHTAMSEKLAAMTAGRVPFLGVRWDELPGRARTERRVVSAAREVAAPADRVFELIADPARQPEWDGNDNLARAAGGQRVRALGDVFVTTLTRGAERENHVVELEEGRRLAWRPSEPGAEPPGHLWRWEVEPLGEGRCRVSHTYDWTGLRDPARLVRARATTRDRLLASVDRLAALAEAEESAAGT